MFSHPTRALALLLICNGAGIFAQNPEPTLVGEVGGKEFYYTHTTQSVTFNWEQAKSHCAEFALELASIETTREFAFLKDQEVLGAWYWTDGRDSHTPRQFSWDKSNGTVSDALPFDFANVYGFHTCVSYVAHLKQLQPLPCSTEIANRNGGVLCERIIFGN